MVPPPPRGGGMSGGVIAIIIAGVLFLLIGPMAVMAIYGVRKYIANAKTAEARNSLGQIAKDAARAYESESAASPILVAGGTANLGHRMCTTASNSVPASAAAIRGKKYQSSPSEWQTGKEIDAGWYCLKFSIDAPQYFMYLYQGTDDSFTAIAHGDLNGDGVTSTFELTGRASGDTVTIAPYIAETDPQE
jgi:type IV pilus assembly protein PilA